MQSILELTSIEIGHILSELVNENLLVANKNGRWTSYRLNTDYQIAAEQVEISDITNQSVTFKNETDRIIYEYAKTNGFITSAQVQQITSIKSRQGASVALNRLIKRDLLRMNKKGKLTIYEFVN